MASVPSVEALITVTSYSGGGLKHGSIVQVDDQAQHFKVSLVVSHQVRLPLKTFCGLVMCIYLWLGLSLCQVVVV